MAEIAENRDNVSFRMNQDMYVETLHTLFFMSVEIEAEETYVMVARGGQST